MTDLTEKELELLGLLQEECAEVIQIVSKIRRFGIESYNPYLNEFKTNRTLLEDELGDVDCIISLLKNVVDGQNIVKRRIWKTDKLEENGVIPKRPSFKELFNRAVSPEEAAAWESFDADRQAERRQDDILSDISRLKTEVTEENLKMWEGCERKYLLQKAAEILTQIERLPDED